MITRLSTRKNPNKPAYESKTWPQNVSSLDLQDPEDDEDDLEEDDDDIDTDDTIDDDELLKTGTRKDDLDDSAAVNADDSVDLDDDELSAEDFDEDDDDDEDETLGTL